MNNTKLIVLINKEDNKIYNNLTDLMSCYFSIQSISFKDKIIENVNILVKEDDIIKKYYNNIVDNTQFIFNKYSNIELIYIINEINKFVKDNIHQILLIDVSNVKNIYRYKEILNNLFFDEFLCINVLELNKNLSTYISNNITKYFNNLINF